MRIPVIPRGLGPFRIAVVLTMGMAWAPGGLVAAGATAVSAGPSAPVPASPPARAKAVTQRVEAWVVLSMPGEVSLPARTAVQRKDQQFLIGSQQSAVLLELTALGAMELGRQTLTRSALLVEVDEAMFERIAKIPGVLRVQKVTHRHATDGPAPAKASAPGPGSR